MSNYSKLKEISQGISKFLHSTLLNNSGFGARSFYGEAFTLALLKRESLLDDKVYEILIDSYKNIDKSDPEFHWEFNNYAFSDFKNSSRYDDIEKIYHPIRFKGTACTNWTLLRSNVRLRENIDTEVAINEIDEKIRQFQKKSGLILDDKGVKSFQYHCFSMAMIGEIYELTRMEKYLHSFISGVDFIRRFILSNGESLYIGRGQNQSFGYGALIYILALYYKITKNREVLTDIDATINFICKYQKPNGSFPLVISGSEIEIPKVHSMHDTQYLGWYPYNNYYDYLPFMGFFINKSYDILSDCNVSSKINDFDNAVDCYNDNDFLIYRSKQYQAVVSKPGGYWSNDLPIPYVVKNGLGVTPIYGGEQFQDSLYSTESIPLPFCRLINKSIRWRSLSWLYKNNLFLVSPLGVMIRSFSFNQNSIIVSTRIFSLLRFSHLYLFKPDFYCEASDLKFDGYGYSATGLLNRFISNPKFFHRFKIDLDFDLK